MKPLGALYIHTNMCMVWSFPSDTGVAAQSSHRGLYETLMQRGLHESPRYSEGYAKCPC